MSYDNDMTFPMRFVAVQMMLCGQFVLVRAWSQCVWKDYSIVIDIPVDTVKGNDFRRFINDDASKRIKEIVRTTQNTHATSSAPLKRSGNLRDCVRNRIAAWNSD